MKYKPFLYCSIISIIYGLFLRYQLTYNWKTCKSIVTNVKVNNSVINKVNGLNITEVESNADVIYKLNNNILKSNVSVIQSQPLQRGNIIPIRFNENDRNRIDKNIPDSSIFFAYGIILLIISIYIQSKN